MYFIVAYRGKDAPAARWFTQARAFSPSEVFVLGGTWDFGCDRTKRAAMKEPTVVISLDLELIWGSFHHAFSQNLVDMARWTRDVGVPKLLELLTRNSLSATWAIVGAMMRDRLPDTCQLPVVHYPHFPKPWFSYIPSVSNESNAPELFGPSLVEIIQKAVPRQEIGFHSFSHVIFGAPSTSRERAAGDLKECRRIADEMGFRGDSFVFPYNSVAYIPELRDAGFKCYREVEPPPFGITNVKLRALLGVLADFAGSAPNIVQPFMNGDLVAIPGSLMIRFAAGWRKFIPDSSRRRRLKKGLELLQKRGGVFHVWFHPENLYAERPRLENVVAEFLDELGALVDKGRLRCLTMGQLAQEYRAAGTW